MCAFWRTFLSSYLLESVTSGSFNKSYLKTNRSCFSSKIKHYNCTFSFWETRLWVTLGDLALKRKLIREIRIQLKIDEAETKFTVRKIITIIWVTCVQKNSQIQNLYEKLLAKCRFLKKNCTYSQKLYF